MTWINRTALGLLGLLDGKVSGFVPNDVSGTISPVLNLEDAYAAETRRVVQVNQTVTFAGQTAQVTVPDGFAWRVEAMGIEAIGTAGWIPITPEIALAAGATEQRGYGLFLPKPIWLGPGTSIGYVTSSYTDGGANLFARLRCLVNQVPA